MADDIKFVIGVDDSEILKSIKNHQILENRVEQLTKEYANLDKLYNTNKLSLVDYSRATKQLDKEIGRLNSTLRKGGSAVNQLATGMNVSGKSARRNEIAFQQAGYQVQDFIVQVQGGTNPLIAFSQQGSQLAGFFAGPWGAMIGLGIAALSSLAMAFLSTGEDAKRLQENLDDVGDKLDDFEGRVKSAEDTISSFTYAMAKVQSTQIKAAWSELGDATAGSFEAAFMAKFGRFLYQNLWAGFEGWGDVAGTLSGESFAAAFGTTTSTLGDDLLEQIGTAVKEQNVALLDSTIEGLSLFSGMTTQGAQFLEYLIKIRDEANGFTEEVKDAAAEIMLAKEHGEDLSKLNLKLGIQEAVKVAELLAENLNVSLQKALGIVGLAEGKGVKGPDGAVESSRNKFGDSIVLQKTYSTKGRKSGGGGSKTVVDINEIIEARKKQAEQERVLIGLSGEQEVAQKTYFDLLKQNEKADIKLTDTELKGAADAIAAYEEQNRVLEGAKQQQEDIATSIANNFGDAFMSIVDGTKTAKEAFKDMARAIIKDLFRILVVEQMVKSIKSFISPSISAAEANGGAWQGGSKIQAYANGGVVGGPTYFPMAGGKTGLMGEAGPEAIMPLKRGANGKLGVQADGASQGNVVVNQSFNFQANGDDSVKKLIAQAAPQIANMTQKQIMDSRRRGGSMKAAFG